MIDRLCEFLRSDSGDGFVCRVCGLYYIQQRTDPNFGRPPAIPCAIGVSMNLPGNTIIGPSFTNDGSMHRASYLVPPNGPGNFLAQAIESFFGEKPNGSCGCEDRILQMNAWGPTECRKRIAEITDWLVKQIEEYKWLVYATDDEGNAVKVHDDQPPWLIRLTRAIMHVPIVEKTIRWKVARMVLAAIKASEEAIAASSQLAKVKATFVYPYLAKAAKGDELLYSVRSVEQFYQGEADIWIVGDRPDWWERDNRFIRCHKVNGGARIDRANKLSVICQATGIPETFVWMQDDIYFLKPVTWDFLTTRWTAGRTLQPEEAEAWAPKHGFKRQKAITYRTLVANGKPLNDHAVHVPCVYEKSKVAAMLAKYDLTKTQLVDDLLYLNEYAEPTKPPIFVGSNLVRITQPIDDDSLKSKLTSATLLNHTSNRFSGAIEEYLDELFVAPCKWETPLMITPAYSSLSDSQDATTMALWSFWDGPEAPPYIKLCQETLLHHNPNAKILNYESFRELQRGLPDENVRFRHLHIVHQSDWIRLWLLRHFGGIWIDADCIVMRPLDRFLDALRCCWSMTYCEDGGIMGGFIGTPPNSCHIDETYSRARELVKSKKTDLRWRQLLGANMETVVSANNWQGFFKLDRRQFIPIPLHRKWKQYFIPGSDDEHRVKFNPLAYTYMLSHNSFPKRLRGISREGLLTSNYFISYVFRKAITG